MIEKSTASPKPKKKRWFLRFLLRAMAFVAALIFVGIIGGYYFLFHRAMPDYSGEVALNGLAAPVSILRDGHGVPHIFATNRADALRTLGYVHASERFFQMEMQRRAGQGRLSEVAGPDMLSIDKFIRTLGIYGLAQSGFAAMSPEAKVLFQAYSDGVNDWLATHGDKLPLEFRLLKITPEPWQPADSVVWGKLMALQLSKNLEQEKLRAVLARDYPAARTRGVFAERLDEGVPVTLSPPGMGRKAELGVPAEVQVGGASPHPNPPPSGRGLRGERDDALAQLGALIGLDHAASNEWVIGGARTASGKPILANDPHLGLEAPILWYLVRIVTPDGELKGATVPGLPVVLLGQNSHIAWGFTTTGSDVQDLFVETLDKDDAAYYVTPKGREKFAMRDEVIHVRGEADVTLKVRATRHGPVLSDVDAEAAGLAGSGKVMALAFTGLGDRDVTAESLLRLNKAANWSEFLDALKLYQAPPQNVAYADREGHIGFINPGLMPVRKGHSNGTLPGNGATGDNDWIGIVPFTQLPQLYDPPAQVIFNANNALVDVMYPYWLGMDWEEPYRAQRLQELLTAPGKQTLDLSAAMQGDHVSLAARSLAPLIWKAKTENARLMQAQAMLRNWDGTMDRDRPEPLIFEGWLYELGRLMFNSGLGNPLTAKGPLKAQMVAALLTDKTGTWCPKQSATVPVPCDGVILKALDKALSSAARRQGEDMAQWRWGRAHQATLQNKVLTHVPGLKKLADITMPSSGDFYTLDRGGNFAMKEPQVFSRMHGSGYRGIYDLNDPAQSRFMIATGQSGHVFSSHYSDLAGAWNEVKSFPITGGRDELLRGGAQELKMVPAGR